jgi:putative nucleotidyltransferase with HDIG domain
MSENFRSPVLAKIIAQHRTRIIRSAIRRDDGGVLTVGVELRSDELLDALARAAASGDAAVFRAWLFTALFRTPATSQVKDAFSVVFPEIRDLIVQKRSSDPGEKLMLDLDENAQAIFLEHTVREPVAAHEALDEIDAGIERLVARLDVQSPLTGEHSRAVSAWCARLARRMSLSEAECIKARRGGLVHDVGKAATPTDILEAPRSLTPQEWTTMKSHTTAGAALLETREALRDLIPTVRHHHERLDGKGYPDGLQAAEIPLVVRIVTVADCFNAMVGRRPYRPPLPPTRALEELTRHRGTQFDPDVVEAMVQLVDG